MSAARRVLVTGASRGIGRAIALALGGEGFDIGVHYHRSASAAEKVADAIRNAGGAAHTLAFDVADRDACARELEKDVSAHGAYWGIVANAGITADGTFAAMPPEDWDRVLATNLDGFYNVAQPLTMPMVRLRDGGRIVTVSSLSGVMGNRGQVNYSAAKAGLIGATKALAVELASRAITVNCIAPGLIESDMTAEAPREEIMAQIPAGRLGTPKEVAALVAFLFQDAAAYITRQVIGVNGGMA
ncbi:MAG: 3-oxoacyl-ACP reductase FabG [Gammaproteobacteria bacterium]|nr:3-oxoacyl-ACP reductase FabG [Gammaproteobacteria bacterium]